MAADFEQTFTNGLARDQVVYDSDDGTSYSISEREAYLSTGASSLPAATFTTPLPVKSKPRLLHLASVGLFQGKKVTRQCSVSNADIGAYFGAAPSKGQVTIDGIVFEAVGYSGELRHG